MSSATNKVIIVTGGSKGVGAAVVKLFLQEGAKYVAILDIDEETGKTLEHEMNVKHGNAKAKFIKCDVTNDSELTAAFEDVIADHGYIDVVVNNAGIGNESRTMYKKMIEVNFTAVVTGTIKALELMRKDRGGRGGTIINISSLAALLLLSPTLFIYSATKAAVLQFTTSMGMKPYYERTNVRMLSICLGLTDTNILPDLKSFDPQITEEMPEIMSHYPSQSADDAGKGIIEAFKKGESASVWLVNTSTVKDITGNVTSGYETMLGS